MTIEHVLWPCRDAQLLRLLEISCDHLIPSSVGSDTNEFFSGMQAWSSAMRDHGLVTNTFELCDDEEQNMLTPEGFCLAVKSILETRAAGLNLFAVVCSCWTFLNRGTSGRNPLRPLGNQGLRYVREANVMVAHPFGGGIPTSMHCRESPVDARPLPPKVSTALEGRVCFPGCHQPG